MNQGEFTEHQLLQPDTVAEMHNITSRTGGDFMQTGYGSGWAKSQTEPRQMWDITFQPRGFRGHGGRFWGYGSAMPMVEDGEGAYGYVLQINTSMVESLEEPWFFGIQANLQDLLLSQAHRMYKSSTDG